MPRGKAAFFLRIRAEYAAFQRTRLLPDEAGMMRPAQPNVVVMTHRSFEYGLAGPDSNG